MRRAADALDRLCGALESAHTRIEFSIVSDTAYYNGVALRGYIEGAPMPVLRGGEYGKLLARLGKGAQRAIGFALYLGELARCLPEPEPDGGGTLLLYDAADAPGACARGGRAARGGGVARHRADGGAARGALCPRGAP